MSEKNIYLQCFDDRVLIHSFFSIHFFRYLINIAEARQIPYTPDPPSLKNIRSSIEIGGHKIKLPATCYAISGQPASYIKPEDPLPTNADSKVT